MAVSLNGLQFDRVNAFNYSINKTIKMNMKVEIEMYTDDKDESIVMDNIKKITKSAKEMGFKIGEIEIKNERKNNHKDDHKDHHKDHHH